jgi:hypothetical protein
MHCHQAEQPAGAPAERAVGPREQRSDVDRRVHIGEGVQAVALVAQFRSEGRDAELRVGRRAGCRDRQSQRQPGTVVDDRGHGLRLGGGPGGAEPAVQHHPGFRHGQQVQRDWHSAFRGDEAGEPVAAGDDDRAVRGAGQQRPHLLGVSRVVQYDQHPPIGQQVAVERELVVDPRRQIRRRHAERREQAAHRVSPAQRRATRVEAAEAQVELPVRELVRDRVFDPDGKRRLADAGRTGHGQHRGLVRDVQQGSAGAGEFLGTPDETR